LAFSSGALRFAKDFRALDPPACFLPKNLYPPPNSKLPPRMPIPIPPSLTFFSLSDLSLSFLFKFTSQFCWNAAQ
jgi:hypothetical protein